MRVEIEGEAAAFVQELVRTGRFASAQDAVEDAVRLSELRERKIRELRALVQEAEAEGGEGTLEDLDRELEELFQQLEKEFPE